MMLVMRAAVVTLLGIALLAVLWLRRRDTAVPIGLPVAPAASEETESAQPEVEASAAATVEHASPSPRMRLPESAPTATRDDATVHVAGCVLWADRTPAGRALVRHAIDRTKGTAVEAFAAELSDVHGEFTLALPRGFAGPIEALCGAGVARAVVDARAPPARLELLVPCVPSVRGTLRDARGRGAAGTVDVWERDRNNPRAWRPGLLIPADDSGRFSIQLIPGTYAFLGRAGAARSDVQTIVLAGSAPTAFVALALAEPAVVAGTVVDERGAKVGRGCVTLTPEAMIDRDGPPPSPWFATVYRPKSPLPPWMQALYGAEATQQLGAAGAFSFAGVSPHTKYQLTFFPQRGGPLFTALEDIPPDATNVRLVVRDGALSGSDVTGVVRGENGAPLTDGEVLLTGSRRWVGIDPTTARFHVADMPADAECTVLWRHNAVSPPRIVGSARIARGSCELDVQLPARGALEILVRAANGDPARDVFVSGVHESSAWLGYGGFNARTDADSAARVPEIVPGKYHVVAHRGDDEIAAVDCTLAPGATERVELQATK